MGTRVLAYMHEEFKRQAYLLGKNIPSGYD